MSNPNRMLAEIASQYGEVKFLPFELRKKAMQLIDNPDWCERSKWSEYVSKKEFIETQMAALISVTSLQDKS